MIDVITRCFHHTASLIVSVTSFCPLPLPFFLPQPVWWQDFARKSSKEWENGSQKQKLALFLFARFLTDPS